ncbi:hydroxyacid dehydrogenase [candidate division WWE3 bacterium CG06_land_8_20_14_3_00_42_16]|uniref:Hydroxyacid dehydrogenase n=2 Tax=Katanobacteria TaxID=422282 RepID=A0A2M7AMD8_UNCKA|nr:MAG: hydroxyacid dehydrogenase [candidate division WWE3 bacterium CG06_land_8_20_14_3_00_42_16]
MKPKIDSQIILYQAPDGQTKIEVKLQDETVWLIQAQMAELFQTTKQNVSLHIKNIFSEKELDENSVVKEYLTTAVDGKKYSTLYYNLDLIISVGYRINSHRGTQFRIWATKQLREYIVKGFVMDDRRLEEGKTLHGINYFNELLERVRAIRASERNFYEKVRDTFATSIDYDSKVETAKDFYSTVQNKFHFAITGLTAAEIVTKRIDSKKPSLGLTNWIGEIITRQQAEIAKNYLEETELRQLKLLVEQFLAYAELQVERKNPMYMSDWKRKLDEFMNLNDLEILTNKGAISHEEMQKKVKAELVKFTTKQIKGGSRKSKKI